jgi:hypothetical protein
MAMSLPIPSESIRQLGQLRGRERLFRLIWGITRVLTVFVVLLLLACIVDWWVDQTRETPRSLRTTLTITQILISVGLVFSWILRPLKTHLSDEELADRAEKAIPSYRHRLVTAIQLSRSTAKIEGMSKELITNLTNEAETITRGQKLAQLADQTQVKRAGYLFGVPVLIAVLFVSYFGLNLTSILFQRQLGFDVDIPHFVKLAPKEEKLLRPAGEEVTLQYVVEGRVDEESRGKIKVYPEDLPADEYPLEFAERIDENTTLFKAKIPPSTVNFEHRAWLRDGRSKQPGQVLFEPRPVVQKVEAWVQLPDFLGRKPDGQPYEQIQQQGEIVGLPSSQARLKIETQKPITEATLTLIRRAKDGVTEEVARTQAMQIQTDEQTAEASFPLDSRFVAYRIDVKDQHGFENDAPPRRGIALAPDDPPLVTLLPERFPAEGEIATEDTEAEGMPIPIGKSVRVAYTCRSPQGLAKAQLSYRVNEGSWMNYPLNKIYSDDGTGPFDARTGAFQNSKPDDRVEFHPMPSIDPQLYPSELEGGGRFDFQTKALKKRNSDGTEAELEVGDRVEFHIEIYDKNPQAGRPPGRSEARIKSIVTDAQFVDWVLNTLQSEARIRQLEEKQRGVFSRPGEKDKR